MKRLLLLILIAVTATAAENEQDNSVKQQESTVEPMGTEKKAVELINKLIKSNQSFGFKIVNPLMPGKIRLWQQRGLVRYPTKLTPWVTFKDDIQKFGSNLYTLLAKDPQTNNYYHIEAFRKNHELYKAFESLLKTITEHEPKIELLQPFKLSKESMESLQTLINTYGTMLYQDKLLEKLNALLKSFDTKAKEIRTSQEKQEQVAQKKPSSLYNLEDTDDEIFNFDESYSDEIYEAAAPESTGFDLEGLDFGDDFISSFFE